MPSSLPRRPARGFTLVEVLVALFVMAILAAMAWRGIDGIARARDAGDARLQSSLRFTNVMAQWEADLRALRNTGDVVPAIAFDGGTLRLTRSSPGGVQLVAWSLKNNRWLRWASPAVTHVSELQEWWIRSQQLNGSESDQLQIFENVVDWNVQFFVETAWTNAQSSRGTVAVPGGGGATPVQTVAVQPRGVRLMLTFAEGTVTRDLTVQIYSGPSLE